MINPRSGDLIEVAGLAIPDEVQATVLGSHIDALKHGHPNPYDYRPIVAARTVASMGIYLPSILLVFNASLDVLARPDIAVQLPNEVVDRKEVGLTVIKKLAKLATESDDLADANLENFELSQGDMNKLKQEHGKINTFAGQILKDTTPIMGGAAIFLTEQGIDQAATLKAIQHSPLSRFISKSNHPSGAAKKLGYNYCSPLYYQWVDGSDMPTVDFTAEAIDIFNESEGKGCPVRRIALPKKKCNQFTDAWQRAAAYLLPAGFSVDQRQNPKD